MTTNVKQLDDITILDDLRSTREAIFVRRAFGEAYELDGVTVIPVARISGGAGGGDGEGTGPDDEGGRGFGTGFGVGAQPVGVYEVRGDEVEWKPALDLNRLTRGAQVLAGIVAVCVALVLMRRR